MPPIFIPTSYFCTRKIIVFLPAGSEPDGNIVTY